MDEPQRLLLHGDAYRCRRALAKRHAILAEDDPGIERMPRFTDEIDWNAWSIELRSGALFSPSRHFVVRAAGKLTSPKPLLQALAGDLEEKTFATLLFPTQRKGSALLKGFAKFGRVVALPTPRRSELGGPIQEILQTAGCPAPRVLVESLIERGGDDLLHHAQEARKLATYLGESSGDRVPEVLLYTAGERSRWTLLTHIGSRDAVAAFGELARLHDDPGGLLSSAIGQLALVAKVRTLLDDRVPLREMMSITRKPDWLVKRLVRQAKAWHATELRYALRSAIALDVSVKDGERRPADALTELILATLPRSP